MLALMLLFIALAVGGFIRYQAKTIRELQKILEEGGYDEP